MRYDDIIKYFESDEGITTLLNSLRDDYFNPIDEYAMAIMQDTLSIDEINQTKSALAGIIANLQPIYSKALSLKKQHEYRFAVDHKEDGSATSVEKAAKSEVKRYRDVRDILCGYIKAAESLYFDCKDKTESQKREYGKTDR